MRFLSWFASLTVIAVGCLAWILFAPASGVDEKILVACSSGNVSRDCARTAGRIDTSPLGFTYHYFDQFAEPVRWSPCHQVPYWINPGESTPEQQNAVHNAFTTASTITGITFTYRGTTTQVPLATGWEPEQGVVVAFTTENMVPALAGRVAALTDVWWRAAGERGEPGEIYAAGIAIDENTAVPSPTGEGSWEVIALHEIGHALNLGHVHEPDSVMRSMLNRNIRPEFPQGDAAGLRLLYQPDSCTNGT